MNNNTLYRIDKRDWIYDKQKLKLPKTTYNEQHRAFWQSEAFELKNSCSIHGCITAITNQYPSVTFSLEDRKDILVMATERGFSSEWGWYMASAVKCVADYCRINKGIDLKYYRVNWKHFRKLTKLGFGVVTGFKIRDNFGKDRFDDGELNGSGGIYGDTKYGHLISLWSVGLSKWYQRLVYVDNYANKHRFNETKINHRHLAKLVADDVLFSNGYIYSLK